jgi:hypothetical protein
MQVMGVRRSSRRSRRQLAGPYLQQLIGSMVMASRYVDTRNFLAVCLIATVVFSATHWATGGQSDDAPKHRLAIVWTSGDPDVADHMALMYLHASQRSSWFEENLVIVWGPSARLLAGDKDLQAKVQAMIKDGVQFQACRACADMYGVTNVLEELGIDVKYMGQPLTRMIQDDGWDVLTF